MKFTENPITAKITAAYNLEWFNQDKLIEKRTTYMLYFRVKGSSIVSGDEGSVSIDEGDILLFPKNYAYRHVCEYEIMYAVLFASAELVTDKILKFSSKNPKYFEDKFSELFKVWSEKKPSYEYRASILFYKILAEIEREDSEAEIDRLQSAVEYLHENFSDPLISVDRLFSMCGMSDTYFRRLFVERFGITPLKYINKLRLAKAKELLECGYYTVEHIAELCGFNNINYFSLFFKRETGYPPSLYMRIIRE